MFLYKALDEIPVFHFSDGKFLFVHQQDLAKLLRSFYQFCNACRFVNLQFVFTAHQISQEDA